MKMNRFLLITLLSLWAFTSASAIRTKPLTSCTMSAESCKSEHSVCQCFDILNSPPEERFLYCAQQDKDFAWYPGELAPTPPNMPACPLNVTTHASIDDEFKSNQTFSTVQDFCLQFCNSFRYGDGTYYLMQKCVVKCVPYPLKPS